MFFVVVILDVRSKVCIMQETKLPKKIKKREMIQLSLDEELAQKLHAKELAKETARQEQERYNLEKALELQKQLDQRKEDVDKGDPTQDIDWNDPKVLRYHALQNKVFSKAKVRKNMCTYLKNQEGYKQSYFKGMKYEDIRPIFERKLDKQTKEEIKAQANTDQEIEEMKLFVKIVPDEDIAIDDIPLATKPSVIVEYKIVKEGKISTYHIIRADRSTKRYTSMIMLLENIDREDLETLWKLVKEKHRNTRPEEDYERVLWGDIKVMFEPDIENSKSLVEGSEVCIIKESPYVYEMPKKKKKPQSKDKGKDKAEEDDINANVEMILQKYILRRWTKNLIPAALKNKRNKYGEKNVVRCFVEKLKSLKKEVEADCPNPPSKNKTDNLEQLVEVPKPSAIDVNNPTVGSTKGRKKLRINGGKEKAIEKSLKVRNSYSLCGGTDHNKRTFPGRFKGQDEVVVQKEVCQDEVVQEKVVLAEGKEELVEEDEDLIHE
nr:protein FAR1-related sequence 5 [Tanacetum cinerariifolium]